MHRSLQYIKQVNIKRTKTRTSKEAIEKAKAEIGYTENPKGSNRTKYGEAYGWNGVAWCVEFVWYVLKMLILKTASSTTLKNWFKKKNRFFSTPELGDVVFFNFDKNPKPGECTHVGIVVQILSKTKIKTVEGNTSFEKEADGSPQKESNGGAVAMRTRVIDKTVIGFGRPEYTDSKTSSVASKYLRLGSSGPEVLKLHNALWLRSYGVDRSNSTFDTLTDRCVRHFQASNSLEIDGIVGPETAKKLNI